MKTQNEMMLTRKVPTMCCWVDFYVKTGLQCIYHVYNRIQLIVFLTVWKFFYFTCLYNYKIIIIKKSISTQLKNDQLNGNAFILPA